MNPTTKRTIGIVLMSAMVFMMAEACSDNKSRKPSSRISTHKQVKKPIAETVQPKTEMIKEVVQPIVEPEMTEITDSFVDDNDTEVMSMTICSKIKDREPVDSLSEIELSLNRIYTHTAISNEQADTIYHVYKFDNTEVARVALFVGESPRWRTWSSKYLDPAWVGDWVVEIQNRKGQILDAKKFEVIQSEDGETPGSPSTLSSM